MREIPAVPLIYEKRSVIILEPMSESTEKLRRREEVAKYRDGIKSRGSNLGKRKREDEDNSEAEQDAANESDLDGNEEDDQDESRPSKAEQGDAQRKRKKHRGPKEPNPLAVKRAKKRPTGEHEDAPKQQEQPGQVDGSGDTPHKKRKRKKKHAITADATEQPVTPAVKTEAATVAAEGTA
jgi:U3 small nucleolar RNA-associated protein 23